MQIHHRFKQVLLWGIGTATILGASLLPIQAQVSRPDSEQIGEIYQLQAAFHRAKTTQDIDLMMSLWDPNGILIVKGDPNSPYVGFDQLKAFWLGSGSFTHRRFSLVPSFKIRISVFGDQASLYFECHDVGDYDLGTSPSSSVKPLSFRVWSPFLGRNWFAFSSRRIENP